MQQNTGNDKAFVISCLPLLECVSVEKKEQYFFICVGKSWKYFKTLIEPKAALEECSKQLFPDFTGIDDRDLFACLRSHWMMVSSDSHSRLDKLCAIEMFCIK